MKEIKLTRHSIEEYINDNPNKKDPEWSLKSLFIFMLWKCKKKEWKFWWNDNIYTMEVWYERIIYTDDFKIITYYKFLSSKTIKLIWKIQCSILSTLQNKKIKQNKINSIDRRMQIQELTNKQRLNMRKQEEKKKKVVRIKKLKKWP